VPQAGTCRQGAKRLEGLNQASLFDPSDRLRPLRLQVKARRPGCSQRSDQGHPQDAGEIRISPGPCAATTRWLGHQRQTRLSDLSGVKRAKRPQNAETSHQGQAARGSNRSRPDCANDCGHLQSFLSNRRSALSYRGDDVVLALERIRKIADYPRRSASTRDRSLSPAISIIGLIGRGSS
jgi:hypothetical protein